MAADRIPHNLDAERIVLASMVLANTVTEDVIELVDDGDFYGPRHGDYFAAIVKAWAGGESVDPVSLSASVDGLDASTVIEWEGMVTNTANVTTHARIVAKDAQKRRLMGLARDLDEAAREETEPADIIADAARRLDEMKVKVTGVRERRAQLHDGTVLLDTGDRAAAIWGNGTEVMAPAGESLIIAAPQGLGKTTTCQQFILRRCGVRTDPLLGMPVVPGERRSLVLALDRPSQAIRSMARMVTDDDRPMLEDRLRVWKGPLPQTVDKDPTILAQLAADADADTIMVDSIKDLTPGCASDEMGATINRALQFCLAEGVEVIAAHHQRKAQQGGGKPKSLDDVYGSTFITAGAGSVVLLWGTPGDSLIDLIHLKQPQDPVGPLRLALDFDTGTVDLADSVDLLDLARRSATGLTAEGAARALYGTDSPDRNDVERARRKLRNHPHLTPHDGPTPPGGGKAIVYFREAA